MWESGNKIDKSKMMNKKRKINKKAWIRIAEAFVSVLIVVGAAMVVIKGGIQTNDISEKIYDIEVGISREIRLNDNLRSEILLTSGTVEWNDLPSQTKNKIIDKTPKWLECVAKICSPESQCLLSDESEKSIYAQSAIITSTVNAFNPRQLKLFCWEK